MWLNGIYFGMLVTGFLLKGHLVRKHPHKNDEMDDYTSLMRGRIDANT